MTGAVAVTAWVSWVVTASVEVNVLVTLGTAGGASGVGTPVWNPWWLVMRPSMMMLLLLLLLWRRRHTDIIFTSDGLDDLGADLVGVGVVVATLQVEGLVGVPLVVVVGGAGASEEGGGGHDGCLHCFGLGWEELDDKQGCVYIYISRSRVIVCLYDIG